MKLKDINIIKLPQFRGGSFSGMDRLLIAHNLLVLKEVTQREDNGLINLTAKAVDGPEELSGRIKFAIDDRLRNDVLANWLKQQIGRDIESIYHTDFVFGDEPICPHCKSEMFLSMEPKVSNLANSNSKFPIQSQFWRCSVCDHKEKIQ